MNRIADVISGVLGLLMLSIGVQWLVVPASTAGQLGMVLLDGAGRASQIGDGASFFLGTGLMLAIGAWRRNATLLTAGALMIGSVALFRIIAAVVHGADFTPAPIVVEVITLVAGLTAAQLAPKSGAGA